MLINKKRGDKANAIAGISLALFISVLLIGTASAGVGIKWDRQGAIVEQGSKTCLSYYVYNPWEEDSYATIGVSEPLQEVLKSQQADAKFIPAKTSSAQAIPVEFCFEVPFVYSNERNCLIGDFLCEQACNSPQREFKGEVIVTESKTPTGGSGSGGSATAAAVSAPLVLKVSCIAHGRDYKPVYGIVALILAIVLGVLIFRKLRRPKSERYKDEIKKLEEKLKQERKKNK